MHDNFSHPYLMKRRNQTIVGPLSATYQGIRAHHIRFPEIPCSLSGTGTYGRPTIVYAFSR